MFPQFGATAESLSKASTLVFRIGSDAHLYDDPDDVNIANLLDSKFDSEKAEALKRLLALIAQGFDVSNFFPQVVKNVASQSLEVKKLVYLYLLHYAEKRPNEALLSINCFQKDLSDTNALVRAWALRAMAGIRLHVIAPLVLVAATKCSRDPSPYVRKCAANSLSKIHDLRMEENVSALEELVGVLLGDNSPGVIGAAAAAFNSVCPNNLATVGKRFQHLCGTLPDVEEWGQIILIGILLRYIISRHGIVQGSIIGLGGFAQNSSFEEDTCGYVTSDHHYSYEGSQDTSTSISGSLLRSYVDWPIRDFSPSNCTSDNVVELEPAPLTTDQNNDIKIFLQCTTPLLWSRNSGVVLAVAAVHWIIAPKEDVKRIVKPLLFVMRSSPASKYVVLCNIQVFARTMPLLFAPYFEDFFISLKEPYEIKAIKLEILSIIASDTSIKSILQEFQDYVKDPDRRFAANTVAAIGICAQRLPSCSHRCLDGLLALIKQESSINGLELSGYEAGVLTQAVTSIKAIIKETPVLHEKVIVQLAHTLDNIKVSAARALIVWIIGEYNSVGETISNIVLTVFQYLARCFSHEELETKLQIINSTAKIVLLADRGDLSVFRMILAYILELAKLDSHYDIRDRARVVSKVFYFQTAPQSIEDGASFNENASLVKAIAGQLFFTKAKSLPKMPCNVRYYLPGSLSQVVLHAAPGYGPLPIPGNLFTEEYSTELATIENDRAANDDSFGTNNSDTSSEPSNEESDSDFSSNSSVSADNENSDADNDENMEEPLINLSDATVAGNRQNHISDGTTQLAKLMSKEALESWLGEQSNFSEMSISGQETTSSSSARMSIRDVGVNIGPKTRTLLDPTNGKGLRVEYSFSSEISSISSVHVCVDIYFENTSSSLKTNIAVECDEHVGSELASETADLNESLKATQAISNIPTLIPMEEIETLEPGEKITKVLHIRFNHHLLPIKMSICCDGYKHPVKLWPDIGYFIRPLSMDLGSFTKLESQLPGMFENSRRCTFADHLTNPTVEDPLVHHDKFLLVCRSLASKMLNHMNIFLLSVDMPIAAKLEDTSGLCLRFSGEILSKSVPCLVTVEVLEGKCSQPLDVLVKVNCEETVFGLNLLNKIVAFLA